MTGHIYKKQKRNAINRIDDQRVIMHEGDASSTATESEHGSDPPVDPTRPPIVRNVRLMLDRTIHSNKFHVFVVAMVVFNWLILIVELLINLRIFEMGQPPKHNTVSKILHLINVSLLGLFVLEMWFKVLVMGGRFFKHRMEMFDFVVVTLAFSLILAFGGRENSTDSIGLLIVLRLWRVSKIISGMIEAVKHEAERKMAKERRFLRALEREVGKLREYCTQQECELHAYRNLLRHNAIPVPTSLRAHHQPPPAPRTLNVIAEVNEIERKQQPVRNVECGAETASDKLGHHADPVQKSLSLPPGVNSAYNNNHSYSNNGNKTADGQQKQKVKARGNDDSSSI